MDRTQRTFSATAAKDRIQSLDIVRGIVLFGILLMNINGMALAGAYENPIVAGGATGWDLYTWIASSMLFEGTMRGLFSLLFGVSMFIFLERLESKGAGIQAANIYLRRLIWLLLFGLIHGYILLWEGEILYNYALMGFLLFSFRKLSPFRLSLFVLLFVAAGTLWSYAEYKKEVQFERNLTKARQLEIENKELPKELQAVLTEWKDREEKRSPEMVAEHNQSMRKGYFEVMAFLAPKVTYGNEVYTYRYDVWDVLSMMLLGIAFYKLGFFSFRFRPRNLWILALAGYAIGLAVNYYETKLILDGNFSSFAFSKSNVSYDLGRIPLAIGHLCLILLFCRWNVLGWLKNGLAAVGRMALTNYIMHSIIALFLFTGAGFGMFGRFQRHELLYIVAAIWVFQLIASPIWLKYYYYGPVEWLWRNLSYLKWHPFRKARAAAAEEQDTTAV